MRHFRVCMLIAGVAIVSLGLSGCGREDGPVRYQLSGTVTFAGEPVEVGLIEFEPDTGYSGPGESAKIVDGHFETPKGLVEGVMKVTISGFDGIPMLIEGEEPDEWGTPIFQRYQTTIEIPAQDREPSFEVPAAQAIR